MVIIIVRRCLFGTWDSMQSPKHTRKTTKGHCFILFGHSVQVTAIVVDDVVLCVRLFSVSRLQSHSTCNPSFHLRSVCSLLRSDINIVNITVYHIATLQHCHRHQYSQHHTTTLQHYYTDINIVILPPPYLNITYHTGG